MCIYYNTALALGTELQRAFSSSQTNVDLGLYILSKVLGTGVDHFSGSWTPNALKIPVQTTELWESSAGFDVRGENKLCPCCLWFLLLPQALGLAGQLPVAWEKRRSSTPFQPFFIFFFQRKISKQWRKTLQQTALSGMLVWNHTASHSNRRHPFHILSKVFPPGN